MSFRATSYERRGDRRDEKSVERASSRDGEKIEGAARNAYKASSEEKLEALRYASERGGDKAKRWTRSDSGSTVSAQKGVESLDDCELKSAQPVGAQATAGARDRIDKAGQVDASPTARYDKDRFINARRDFDARSSERVEAAPARDQSTGRRRGYDAHVKRRDATLSFRRHGKLLMANAEGLAIAKRGKRGFAKARESRRDSTMEEARLATRERLNAKSRESIQRQAKMERLVNQARRRQRRLGFQSDAHAEVGVAKLWKSVKSKPSDFRSATATRGPDLMCAQGEGAMDQQEKVDERFELASDGQRALEIDAMETGPERALIGVVVKSDAENAIGYAVGVTLGAKVARAKLRDSELKSRAIARSAIKQTLGRLRQLKLDIAKACCDEESAIKKIDQYEWSQDLKAAFRG